ncbi:hypothetical protein [Aliikangiella maris]|uniref:Uncharacterized protein n=2 Tax=Aliikangiella maris TaxID=3162458 RepID=A0ABV2BWB5_9GAMM
MTSLHQEPTKKPSVDVVIKNDKNYAYLSYWGVVRLFDLVDSFSLLLRDLRFKKNMAICFDFTDAMVELTLNDTEIFYHFMYGMQHKLGNSYRLAFVYGDDMTKMLLDFYRLFFARTNIDMQIYSHRFLAKLWLEEPAETSTDTTIGPSPDTLTERTSFDRSSIDRAIDSSIQPKDKE